jgi:hypothetical protein
MGDTTAHLEMCEEILAVIDETRRQTGDPTLGAAIERVVLDIQFRELEDDIFDNPGAIEPWLLRRRRGEA